MNSFKTKLFWLTILIIISLSSCFEPPPCDVEYYYMSPSKITLIKNIPDTTHFNNIFLLTSVKSDTLITQDTTRTNDTTIVTKKMIITNSCNLLINSQDYQMNESDTLFYGNKLVGGTYSRIRFSCDYVNIPQESVDLSIWIKRFTQDCSNWQ